MDTPAKDTILIVDDIPANVGVLFKFLNQEGFDVLVARDGKEAIERVEYAHPDIILLDIMMPEMDGFETCQILKSKSQTQDIPIIFMTALSDTVDKVRGFELGAVDYITKPFQNEEVLARVNTQLKLYKLQKTLENHTIALEHEVNERRRAEEQLQRAKEQAERANRAKSTFLANMSHELRTPLNGILGYTQILTRDKLLNPQQLEGINIIQRSGDYLLTLINDILDLAKIEAERIELYPTDINFQQFLQSITELFEMRAQQKGIAFIYEPITQLPRGIRGDEKRLRQILINLLSNAVKFTDKGGVTFKVGVVDDKLRFEIEDTGIGIAPEEMEKIFQPFQQVGDENYRAEGTGLGLSITKRLVEMMGSELSVKSQLGKGSSFSMELLLPETDAIVTVSEKTATPIIIGYRGTPYTLLVVDDKWENRSVLANLLNPLGFTVVEANNGQEALEILENQPIDLVFTDLVMPVMDGFEFSRQIRKNPQWQHIPIIADSASVFDYHQQLSFDAGCDDFIAKPIRADHLFEILSNHLIVEWIYEAQNSEAALIEEVADESIQEIMEVDCNDEQYQIDFSAAKRLYEAAMMGDVEEIAAGLAALEDLHQSHPLLKKLRKLINHYQVDEVGELLKKCHPKLADG